MKKSIMKDRQGSAMVGAIFVTVVLGLWMAATVQSSFTDYKLSKRYLDMQSALNLAESGLEEGIRAYNSGDWSGWSVHSNGYYKEEIPNWLENGLTGSIRIYVTNSATSPNIAAQGLVTGVDGNAIIKQIRVEMSSSTLFANGLLARRNVILNGNGVTVDSYDSRVGEYSVAPSVSNRRSNGNVASLMLTNTDVLINNGDIFGHLAVGGKFDPSASLHKNAILSGDLDAASGVQDLTRVTEDFYVDLPPVEVPNFASWTDVASLTSGTTSKITVSLSLGNPTDTSPREYQAELIGLSGGETLTIDGPVRLYVRRSVKVSGEGAIRVTSNGSLELYSAESLSISGNGSAYGMQNETKKPEKFIIYNTTPVDGGTSVDVAGNGEVYTVVYAPNSNVHLQGGGTSGAVFGAIVGYEITLNGGYAFHYDEALADLNGDSGLTLESWRELRTAAERLPFNDPSQLPAYF